MNDSSVQQIKYSSWKHFCSLVPTLVKDQFKYRCRGQADHDWKLTSPFERELGEKLRVSLVYEKYTNWNCKRYLTDFKTYAKRARFIPALPNDGDERRWWILGRHHGLVTPILDWTSSPYIAAFFAFSEASAIQSAAIKQNRHNASSRDWPKEVAVWLLDTRVQNLEVPEDEFWFSSESDCSLYRQNAQCGGFTFLSSKTHGDLESYFGSLQCADVLKKIVIPQKEAQLALHDLFLMNIHYATIYPDLDGAARQANRISHVTEWELRNPSKGESPE